MSAPDVQTPAGGPANADQTKTDTEIIGAPTPFEKIVSTTAAELALVGFALHRLSCGAYLIHKWDKSAYAPDLKACRAFLDRVRGRA